MATRKRAILYAEPLQPELLLDMHNLAASLRSDRYADFPADAAATMHAASAACARAPGASETHKSWAEMLLYAAARMVPCAKTFEHRLGAIFLLYALYHSQPQPERSCIPVEEEAWPAFERLRDELRERRASDGFAALHRLWTSGAFRHTKRHHSLHHEHRAQLEGEQSARALGSEIGLAEAARAECAGRLARLGRQFNELETLYASAWDELATVDALPRTPGSLPPLRPLPAEPPAAAERAPAVGLRARESVRYRPYAHGRGGAEESRS